MKDVFDSNLHPPSLPFTTLEGVPTITLTTDLESTLFPYYSVSQARLNANRTVITIFTADHLISIAGTTLSALWDELQLQNIREITLSPSQASEEACSVTAITITPHTP